MDSDNLSNLPSGDSPEDGSGRENEIMQQYFGASPGSTTGECKSSWFSSTKITAYGMILFGMLANPWINRVIYRIPQVSNNPIIAFCIKMFVFMFAMLLISRYAI